MEPISSCIEGKPGTKLSSKQSAWFADETNWVGYASHVFFTTHPSQYRSSARIQPMSEFGVDKQQMISEDMRWYFINPGWNSLPNDSKVCSLSVNNTKSWIDQNTYYIYNSEMDWDATSFNLVKTSNAKGSPNDRFESVRLVGYESRHQVELNRPTVHDAGDVKNSWLSPSDTCLINKTQLCNGILYGEKGGQGVPEGRSLHATYQPPSFDKGPIFPNQTKGILPSSRPLFCRDATKNQDDISLRTSVNQADFSMECSERRRAEGDHSVAEKVVKNRKFRLVIDQKTETQMREELHPRCLSLSDIIRRKYRFLGIPVEVEACPWESEENISFKAFNIMFENSKDVSKALSVIHNGELSFSLQEAKPSPSYHVKYKVLNSVGVFKEKDFRQKWIQLLQKGDIVTANQLRGNKIRIIKWCPAGGEIDFDLQGWVLLKTKDINLLHRIEHREAKKVNGKFNSKSFVVSPLLLIQMILGQQSGTSKEQFSHKPNPKRVSAANFSPFKVLVEIEVRKKRRVPTVIGRLKPGKIVWANQHKGSMLRIMKMDQCGNIVVNADLKPKNWGWVCLKRRGDVKPRLVRISPSEVTKKEKRINSRFS